MSEEMDFSTLETKEVAEEVNAATEVKVAEAGKGKSLVNSFAQKLQANPQLQKALYSMSKNIEIINTCGYGDGGNLIRVKDAPKESELVKTATIVGYVMRNIGNEPIAFTNGIWTKNDAGIYEEKQIEDVINPGETKAISRKYLTIMAVRPEFSLTLANGRVVASSSTNKAKSTEALISSYHFKFTDSTMTVNDDKIKIAIADKKEVTVDGSVKAVWTVKPEYCDTFGNLNNPKASNRKTRASVGGGIDLRTAAAADYVKSLLDSNGMK